MNLTTIAAVIAALSIAGNVWLGNQWLTARDALTARTEQLGTALMTAQACSDGVEDLRTKAEQRAREADAAIAQARKLATARQVTAQTILSTPASVPGDDCASAAQRAHDWLATRKGEK